VAPFELRILKALFFLKWDVPVKGLTSQTFAILCCLSISPILDIRAHEQQVKEALPAANLEVRSYLLTQRWSLRVFLT